MSTEDDWAKMVKQNSEQLQNVTINSSNVLTNITSTPDSQPSMAEESLLSKLLGAKLQEISNTATLNVQQRDPNNPLFSARSFEELPLSEELKRGVREMGFDRPSKIQETALPMLINDKNENMIAQSQSGTGKTAAFSLAVLSKIDKNLGYPQALILSPTYELALQTGLKVETMGKFMGERMIAYAVRGTKIGRNEKIRQPIIIGTPGTVFSWLTRFKAFDPLKIKILVFDEADVMISQQGHKDETVKIRRLLPKNGLQCLLFSATYKDKVFKFAETMVPDANKITLPKEEQSLENIKQFLVKAENDEKKMEALYNIYGIIGAGQVMVFCKTKKTAELVAKTLHSKGFACGLLTSQLVTEDRAKVIQRFAMGLERVLISTNLTSRGIDVEQVTLVVNYDLPDRFNEDLRRNEADPETYLHRIGRTGRFGRSGIAINMVSNYRDECMLKDIEKYFSTKIEALDLENESEDIADKLDIVD